MNCEEEMMMKKKVTVLNCMKSAIWYLVVGMLSILFVLPFIWMVSTAFKTGPQCVDYPPTFIPRPFTLRSFTEVFSISPNADLYQKQRSYR